MLPEKHRWISVEFRPEGDARRVFNIARELEDAGNLEGAATAYDGAYALDPAASDISPARTALLD